MKPIIHFKIPAKTRLGKIKDFAVPRSHLREFLDTVGKHMGDDYTVIATPFDIDIIGADYQKVVCDEITLKEFLDKYAIPLDKNE